MADRRSFFGRKPELDQWHEVLADERGQAVLVVGQAGMGKTLLVNEMARLACENPDYTCGFVRYEVTRNDSAASVMESMIEDAFQAAKSKKPFLGKETKAQWQGLFKAAGLIPIVGKGLEVGGELLLSLQRNVRRNTRDEFIDRLKLISDRMPENGRAIFVIDPEKYMQKDSDQDWAIVVRDLPDRIKIIFAQRPDDVLVGSETFTGLIAKGIAVRVPPERLDVLDEAAVEEMIHVRAIEMNRDERELRDAVKPYNRHPYAVPAALDLIAAGTPIDDLPPDPTGIAEAQWKKIGQGGATGDQCAEAVALFQAYAILEVPVPDDVVEIVADVTAAQRKALMHDRFLGPLLRTEGENRRIYHAILADHICGDMTDKEAEPYHRRALQEFRKRLETAKKENTAPDALAARRLAVHVGRVEGPSDFVTAFIEECLHPLRALGQLDAAVVLAEEALARLTDDSKAAAILYGNLGLIYQSQGEVDRAEKKHRMALRINEKLHWLEGMADQYGNLGLIYYTRGDLDGAEKMHSKSLEIERKLGRRAGMADDYGNLGLIYTMRGDLDRAEEMHGESLEINQDLGRLEGISNAYGNLGTIYTRRGGFDRAEEMHRKSLEIETKLGRIEGMANDYANLGAVSEQRGRPAKARELWIKARDLYERAGMPHMVEKVQGWLDGLPPEGGS